VRKFLTLAFAIVLCPALALSANAQLPASPEEARKIVPLFDSSAPNSLKCTVERWTPALDFAFRFVGGYVAFCRVAQFEGKKAILISYLRVTPEGKDPAVLGSVFLVPEISSEMKQSVGGNFKKLKNEIGVSGAVGLGEGNYSVDLLLTDDQHRRFRKSWKLHVSAGHAQRGVALAISPLTVESIDERSWQTVSSQRGGTLRLTVLLDAAPINPYQTRLHAWDRAFLLECVYSVLRQTPHASVRLVAFNLDQQREIFRTDQFDSIAFRALSRALNQVELSSVSVKALKKRDSPEFLITLADQESQADRSDAIIFLGPNSRMQTQVSSAALRNKKAGSLPFFYFEYFPWVGASFPDSIAWLVRAAGGRVFEVHTPVDLDNSIDRMLGQLKQD
jgi:hypothetical protein